MQYLKQNDESMRILFLILTYFIYSATVQADDRPNVIFIMVDDMGYSDIGCYGGEIETPHLDSLAAQGLRMSHFYNTGKCHSSRLVLNSGMYSYMCGTKIKSGYNHDMSHSVTIAESLKSTGYRTYANGKWHIDKDPSDWGYDHYFGHYGNINQMDGWKQLKDDGKRVHDPNDKNFYVTDFQTDHLLQDLERDKSSEKPFFAYLAYYAPHYQIQALKEDVDKYLPLYRQGWDKILKNRLKNLVEKGLIDEQQPIHSLSDYGIPDWNSLEPHERDYQAYLMSVYAGMIDRVDVNIGKLIHWLKINGQFDNTLIFFCSDNGGCKKTMSDSYLAAQKHLDAWDPKAYLYLGHPWATVSNTPFRFFKGSQFEGGVATPMVIHWPRGISTPNNHINPTPAHLVDILPTVLDIAKTQRPASYKNRSLKPLMGVSLAPLFTGEQVEREKGIYLQFSLNRGFRQGKWKAVTSGSSEWELYDLSKDRTEMNNLANTYPEVLNSLVKQWQQIAVMEPLPQKFNPKVKPGSKVTFKPWYISGDDAKTKKNQKQQ